MARPTKRLTDSRRDGAEAFLREPRHGALIEFDDAEAFAEEFIASVTGADFVLEDARNEETDDEIDSARSGSWLIDGEETDDELTAADAQETS